MVIYIYMAYDFGAQWLARQFSQSTSREIAAFIATHVSSVCESNRRVVIISALRNSFVHNYRSHLYHNYH